MIEQEFIPNLGSKIGSGLIWPVSRGRSRDCLEQYLPKQKIVTAEQTHSNQIALVDHHSPDIIPLVDGLVTQEHKLVLAIVVADCQIIIAVDDTSGIIGAAHAGWKGIYKAIGQNLIQTMMEIGAQKDQIKIAISPSIKDCHFEVDGQPQEQTHLARMFKDRFGPRAIKERGSKKFVDLAWAQKQTLIKEGILEENIFVDPRCTVCSLDNFPSHRREGNKRKENLVGYVYIKSKIKNQRSQ